VSFTPPSPEREALPGWRVGAVVLATLAVAVVLTLVGRAWQVTHERTYRAGPPASSGSGEVGYVFQRPFELERSAVNEREQQLKRLRSYGWVDRDSGVIHVPIERAFEAVISAEAEPR
jgi:hypothetical protein